MNIHTSTRHKATAHIARDTDDEIIMVIEGPRGPINVEIHSADEDNIEQLIEDGDEEELEDACETVIGFIFSDLGKFFPGQTFSHFADAPDDNSELVMRERTVGDLKRARESIAYRDLVEGGLSEQEIHTLIA